MSATRYQVIAATPTEDELLRALLRQTPLEGLLRVTLEREPSFFGADHDVTHQDVALVMQGGAPVACGERVIRRAFWLGGLQEVAYLENLRVHPEFQRRAGWGLRAGYQLLKERAQIHPAAATWTAVFTDNNTAQKVLVGRHAGLPEYVARGRLISPLLLVKRREPWPSRLNCARGTPADLPAITRFLQQHLQGQPLAPCLADGDLAARVRWPDLQAEDFVIVRRANEILGVTAVRDLRSYKQVRIAGAPWYWRLARGSARILSALNLGPCLPQVGDIVALGYASFLTVQNNDLEITKQLLLAARCLASRKGLSFLSVCWHERDPKREACRGLPSLPTNGMLYQVLLRGEPEPWPIDVPYLDPANL